MAHDHDHDHEGDHDQGPAEPKEKHDDHAGHAHTVPKDFGRAFATGIALQASFVAIEVVVGLASSSLAVIADAGHNVADVLALILAWGASALGKRGASKGRTYGMKSASILAALFNSGTLLFVNGAVAWEAVGRLRDPEEVTAIPMIVVSLGGVAVNGFSAWLFSRGSEGDVNVRAAFFHLLSDAAVAGGVAVTGVAIYFSHLAWLDPVASLVVSAVVLFSTWSLLKRALDLAMHAVPQGIDEEKLRAFLVGLPGVTEVHDLHVWAMSTTENVLTAHLVMREMPTGAFAAELDEKVRAKFPVHHVTLQLDPHGTPCALAHADAM